MNLDAVAEKAISDAKAAGATDTEAEAKGQEARQEAERIMAHPLYRSLDTEARKAFKDRDEAKGKVRELTPLAQRAKELEDSSKSEAERLKAQVDELVPKAKRAEKLGSMAEKLLEQELADIPENLHRLIPQGDPEDKLLWVRTARAEGVFAPRQKQGAVGSSMPGRGTEERSVKRAVFDAWNPQKRMEHFRKGGVVTD